MGDDRHIIAGLHRQYGIRSSNIRLIYAGVNRIFEVKCGAQAYIFKLFPKCSRAIESIQAERLLVRHAAMCEVPCANVVIPLVRNEIAYTIEGEVYIGLLSNKIAGSQISYDNPDLDMLIAFGRALKALHSCKIPQLENLGQGPAVGLLERTQARGSRAPVASKLRATLAALLRSTLQNPLQLDGLLKCISHGDVWPGNALFNDQGAALIDFEFVSVNYAQCDLASYVWWLTGLPDKQLRLNAWYAFLSGYGAALIPRERNNFVGLIKWHEVRSLSFLIENALVGDDVANHLIGRAENLMAHAKSGMSAAEILEAL